MALAVISYVRTVGCLECGCSRMGEKGFGAKSESRVGKHMENELADDEDRFGKLV